MNSHSGGAVLLPQVILIVAGATGLEPAISDVTGQRFNH